MCMVSNIGDNYKETFPQNWPKFVPQVSPNVNPFSNYQPVVTPEEFAALKKEVVELKKLLTAAADFDKATRQPHCEMDEKVKLIKAIAKLVGVDLGNVFESPHPAPETIKAQ